MGVRGARGKYQAGLARYPGDPEAFVQSRADARRVADKRGLAIHHGPANSGGANQRRSQKEPRPNG